MGNSFLSSPQHGLKPLVLVFLAWKALLILIACASPGSGYDTSTRILLDQYAAEPKAWITNAMEYVVLRLTRWDGIYFATSATRGHVNEQDWAFSWTLARLTNQIAGVLFPPHSISPIIARALVAIGLSHLSHLLAVVSLYHLTLQLIPSKPRIAFTAACLHVFSPAGLFLSAPYGEGSFAFCNFVGMLSYVLAVRIRFPANPNSKPPQSVEALYLVTAGVWFGLAATIRSNGLLSGFLFAWDAVEALLRPRRLLEDFRELARFLGTIAAGTLVAVGFSVPQIVAYVEYCTRGNTRPWCERIPPSIYGWVQDHYWGVGFLRYWTFNNLPLFLIAGPILATLLWTAIRALWRPANVASVYADNMDTRQSTVLMYALPRLALPQLILALMAATSFHVQIINRISSGYPVWYIMLAISIQSRGKIIQEAPQANESNGSLVTQSPENKTSSFFGIQRIPCIVRGMVLYSIVQGGLYASFLPPA